MTVKQQPSDVELDARYADIFERIAQGAAQREQKRELPHEAVRWLKESGFTSLRIPQEYGGGGASLPQVFRQLTRLARADSNLPQILRAHFRFVETRLEGDEALRQYWLPRLAAGETVGSAVSERRGSTENTVLLTPDPSGSGYRLNGEKFYSTGTLYAEWVNVAAHDDQSDVYVMVRTDAAGVTRIDDWDGFGQRMTGSGTTRFDNVHVPEEGIISRYHAARTRSGTTLQAAFVQTVHLATLAGIAAAVQEDGIAYVQRKTRTFGVPGHSEPRNNPLVQRVIGRISSLAWSAQTLVQAVATSLDRLQQAKAAAAARPEDYVTTDIQVFQAQQIVLQQVLEACSLVFEVGGATATSEGLRLDRHWRNARVLASHNPAAQREASIGRYLLNGTPPDERSSVAYGTDTAPQGTAPAPAAASNQAA
nr:acyl-CoA dehydrogenase family protein [Bordetella sp. N]